ncbi:hypothetical protein ACPOLB_20045 [Rubrivivax sp. RP6-9]|uniref:hypothetical protein n=1 Tax=Rubrivivax sp. RP6-9 TaxID=3415750 RepID=UPI003CC50D95
MRTRTSTPPGRRRKQPLVERRAAAGTPGALQRLKALFLRPMRLERHDGRWRLVMVERRGAAHDAAVALKILRDELRARLVAHRIDHPARLMRHLVYLRDELGRRGWAGAEALPADVLARALAQADLLACNDPSPAMTQLIDRLRLLVPAARLREERIARERAAERGERIEVSETTHEDYTEVERSWTGETTPGRLVPERND